MTPSRDTSWLGSQPAPVPTPPRVPHPLSQVSNEFIWEGKYDEQGRRRAPDAPTLPVRLIEEWGSASNFSHRDLATSAVRPNLLCRGDNKLVIAALLPHFRAAVDLIYIDPPYDCGLDYRVDVPIGESRTTVHAYRDTWGTGQESYAHMMAERLMLMRELLHPDGCIFVHCDWRASAVIRLILDDIFGRSCFRNEIVWRRAPNVGRQAASNQLGRVVDSIFVYSAREGTPFRGQTPVRRTPVEPSRSGKPRGAKWDEQRQLFFTTAPRGDYTDQSIERLDAEGRVWTSPSGKIYIKYFLRKGDDGRWYKDQPVDTLWDDPDVRPLRHCTKDELGIGYATQKPEGLLRRIISWACPPGGLVADFFCGSGTTGAVAHQLGRRWILADLGRQAVHTTRKRLLACETEARASKRGHRRLPLPGVAGVSGCGTDTSLGPCSFHLFDLAPHDRLHWFASAFHGDLHTYRRALLDRFGWSGTTHSDAHPGSDSLIHARRDDAVLHVADVDRIVDVRFADALANVARIAGASRVFCLAFEYDVDMRGDLDAIAAAAGIRIHPVLIPPEVTEMNGRERPGWLEVARLEARLEAHAGDGVSVHLQHYEQIAVEAGPASLTRPARAHAGLDLIDAWSIDPDWRPGGLFRPVWHAQRAPRRAAPGLESDPIPLPGGSRSLLVRVVDVFGHETRVRLALPPER